jgi:lipocalin
MFGERGLEDMKIRWGWAPALLLLAGCSGVPKGLQPVTGFDVQKYLGHWNEIARLDHRFERGLTDVTADYRKLPDGRIGVINRGFDAKKNKWKEAEGVARFQDRPDVGSLEVSFFGPSTVPTTCWCSIRNTATQWSPVRTATIYGYSRAVSISIRRRWLHWSSAPKVGVLQPAS